VFNLEGKIPGGNKFIFNKDSFEMFKCCKNLDLGYPTETGDCLGKYEGPPSPEGSCRLPAHGIWQREIPKHCVWYSDKKELEDVEEALDEMWVGTWSKTSGQATR
jgi:hypothetical protein